MAELTGEAASATGLTLPLPPLTAGALAVLAGAVAFWLSGFAGGWSVLVGLLGYLVSATVIARGWRSARFGSANAVTLARVVGTTWIAVLVVDVALTGALDLQVRLLAIIAIGTVCLVLDGVDGWVARTRGEVSAFGARFDVNVDSALLVCLSAGVTAVGAAGWWVFAIPGMRFAYVVMSWVVPVLRIPLPLNYSRKVVSVVQGVALLAALALDLLRPGWMPSAVLLLSLVALGWSFGRDIAWQIREGAQETSRALS
jgi:phosphatidylglycerophosphate synthase